MAIGAITGGIYNGDINGVVQKRTETDYPQESSANISIADTAAPGTVSESGQAGNGQDSSQKERTASEKQIKDAISAANSKIKEHMTRCEYAYHEDTKRISIKVIDDETDEVIREIPPDDTLRMLQKMWELTGLMVDERR